MSFFVAPKRTRQRERGEQLGAAADSRAHASMAVAQAGGEPATFMIIARLA